MKIKTVINYCSNDNKFLIPCVEQAKIFSTEVVVVCYDHLFDGTPENLDILKHASSNVHALGGKFITLQWAGGKPTRYYHNMCRYVGYRDGVEKDYDWILFLDVDEIVEGDKFKEFLNLEGDLTPNGLFADSNFDLIKLANYWYFINSDNRWNYNNEDVLEDSVVMVRYSRKDILSIENFFQESERQAFCDYVDSIPIPLIHRDSTTISQAIRHVVEPFNHKPFVHHYSWVRNKEEMLTKVKTWGHNKDRDWVSVVNEQFKQENLEPEIKDVIFRRQYRKINNPLILFNN